MPTKEATATAPIPESAVEQLANARQDQNGMEDLEARAYDVKTVRVAPKLNLFDRLGARLLKKSKDKEMRTSLTSVEENYQQHHTNHLMSTSSGSMAIEESLGTGGSMSPHPSKINMEQSHEREDAIICQSNSSSAHVEAISPMETEALSSDSTEAEASCLQHTACLTGDKDPPGIFQGAWKYPGSWNFPGGLEISRT